MKGSESKSHISKEREDNLSLKHNSKYSCYDDEKEKVDINTERKTSVCSKRISTDITEQTICGKEISFYSTEQTNKFTTHGVSEHGEIEAQMSSSNDSLLSRDYGVEETFTTESFKVYPNNKLIGFARDEVQKCLLNDRLVGFAEDETIACLLSRQKVLEWDSASLF